VLFLFVKVGFFQKIWNFPLIIRWRNQVAYMKKYISEVLGTFLLLFFGTGVVVVHQHTAGAVGHVGICIVWGLVVMALIYTLGGVSGCHINPAVTITLAALGLFEKKEVVPYILCQVLGAFWASGALKLMFPENHGLGGTMPSGSHLQSWVLELILTFFLMLVVLFTTQSSMEVAQMAGIMIGAVVLLEALFAGPISGASMNPARSLAPAVVSGELSAIWIYLTAPVAGALLAGGTWKLLKS
jgi:aquaporin NIP